MYSVKIVQNILLESLNKFHGQFILDFRRDVMLPLETIKAWTLAKSMNKFINHKK